MTFSVAAVDPLTRALGVAVTTKYLAVGSLCPFVRAGVGAIATQASVNPSFGPRGLRLLAEGLTPEQSMRMLLESDEGREHRQLSVVDAHGRAVSFTGADTVAWSGHRTGPGYAVAGNMLVSEETVTAAEAAFLDGEGQSLPERLLRAIEAGQAAGGDKRGRQSAAIVVYTTEEYPYLDFRVDDHPEPVSELRRIYELSKPQYLRWKEYMPSRAHPSGLPRPEGG
jgi:uncharacterized Ntn-hydrolase superfamily protein